MLIEFSVSNFRSIRDRQTLTLAASGDKDMRETHVVAPAAPATPDLLRAAVIYGPNASGKSNLILALKFARDFVLSSAREGQKGDAIEAVPFLMDEESPKRPTEFEFIFLQDEVRYQYGFAVNSTNVCSEWLTAYPKGKPQTWFERQAGDDEWVFGPNFRGQRKVWQEATRDNALFLSTAVQLNAEQLGPVFDWFRLRLRTIVPYARVHADFSISECERDDGQRRRIVDFLKRADLGVESLVLQRRKFDPSEIFEDMPPSIREDLIKDIQDHEFTDVLVVHRTSSGRDVMLDLEEESGGTQKLFALAGPWLDVLSNGWVLFVDELDTSLHPLLMRQLVRFFSDPDLNPKNAQLIFSTHDTSILDREIFRRDQVWFMEKDPSLASHLYPLTEFSPRKEENIQRGYLQGRYGALPFVGTLGV